MTGISIKSVEKEISFHATIVHLVFMSENVRFHFKIMPYSIELQNMLRDFVEYFAIFSVLSGKYHIFLLYLPK